MKNPSWIDKKLKKAKFRKGFESEFEKLSVADELVRLRKQSGLTQAQLAKKIGTTASAISRYENSDYDRYELKTLRKIISACGGSLKLIVQGPNDEERAA